MFKLKNKFQNFSHFYFVVCTDDAFNLDLSNKILSFGKGLRSTTTKMATRKHLSGTIYQFAIDISQLSCDTEWCSTLL